MYILPYVEEYTPLYLSYFGPIWPYLRADLTSLDSRPHKIELYNKLNKNNCLILWMSNYYYSNFVLTDKSRMSTDHSSSSSSSTTSTTNGNNSRKRSRARDADGEEEEELGLPTPPATSSRPANTPQPVPKPSSLKASKAMSTSLKRFILGF